MNSRRILILAGIALAIFLVALATYFLFFTTRAPEVSTEDPGNIFGTSNEGIDPSTLPAVGEAAQQAGEEIAPGLVRITAGPVAVGAVARSVRENATSSEGTPTVVLDTEIRYVERESGHIYAYRAGARTLTRLTNRTLPGVVEAVWSADGSVAFARFLSENESGGLVAETFALPASEESGYFLESNLSEVAVTGSSTLLTLLPNANGSVATVARIDGSSPRTLFSSLLSSLRITPAGPGYVAYTKASAQTNGYGFLVGGTSGVFERVLGPLRGLTMLPSPSGSSIFYSYLSGSALKSELLATSNRVATAIPLGTLPEKCVWAPDESNIYCAVPRTLSGTLPDDWYQGAVSFSDRIWKIDLDARVAILVVDPKTVAQADMDAVGLAIDPLADVLVFTNRTDGSLWVYDL